MPQEECTEIDAKRFTITSFYNKVSPTRNCQRSESPVRSRQSWPPVHRRLFLGHWIVCRLALSWDGRRCRPWPVCALHRWSWSPHHHTSVSEANHRSSLHSVSGADAEIGSWFKTLRNGHNSKKQTLRVSSEFLHTADANNTTPYHTFRLNYHTTRKVQIAEPILRSISTTSEKPNAY